MLDQGRMETITSEVKFFLTPQISPYPDWACPAHVFLSREETHMKPENGPLEDYFLYNPRVFSFQETCHCQACNTSSFPGLTSCQYLRCVQRGPWGLTDPAAWTTRRPDREKPYGEVSRCLSRFLTFTLAPV